MATDPTTVGQGVQMVEEPPRADCRASPSGLWQAASAMEWMSAAVTAITGAARNRVIKRRNGRPAEWRRAECVLTRAVRCEAERTNVVCAVKKVPRNYTGAVTASAVCAPTPETP